jgi:hypothetical protein
MCEKNSEHCNPDKNRVVKWQKTAIIAAILPPQKPDIMKAFFLPWLLTALILSSCNYFGGKRIRGNGNITTREHRTGAFHSVDVSGAIHVYVKQDSVMQPVKVETDENLQDLVEITESNGVLYISPEDHFNLSPSRDVIVYVSSSQYKGLAVSGASWIRSENKLVSNETFELGASGASEIKLALKAPRVNAETSGASDITLSGETRDLSLQGSGASHFKCIDLLTENASVGVSGASSADVFASVKIDVEASGASGVKYRGAAALTQDVSGASSVKKID